MEILGLQEVRLVDDGPKPLKKQKRVFGLPGVSAGQMVCVHESNFHNMVVSLEQRVFRVKNEAGEFVAPPKPRFGIFDFCYDFQDLWFQSLVAEGPILISSIDDIVQLYSAEKKKLYIKAAKSLETKPIRRSDATVSAFIKVEKLECDAKDPVPRTIQPRSKRYNLVLGQYLRKNEKRMIHAIDRVFGERTVLSGLDNIAQGKCMASKWAKYPNCVGIGLDASRFDQHCSSEALAFEHTFYTRVFPESEELKEILSWQLKNNGVAVVDGKLLRYETDGCRMSGDINTSLGNKLLMCCMVWCYLRDHGIEASLANNGDDCVLFCDDFYTSEIQRTLAPWFLERGYTMVVEAPEYVLERVVFCRSQPVCCNGVWTMVRQLGSLSRDCFTTQDWSQEQTFKDAMNALGQCNGIVNDGIPVHMSQAKCMWRAGGSRNFSIEAIRKQIEYSWRDRLGLRTRLLWSGVVDSTRLSYFRAFGIAPDVQVAVENYFGSLNLSAGEQTLPSLPRFYSRIHKDLLVSRKLI